MSAGRLLNPSARTVFWTGKREVYPIAACMVAAVAWVGYMGGRAMFVNPDVSITKTRRGTVVRDADLLLDEGEAFTAQRRAFIAKDAAQIRIFGSIEKKYA